MKRRRQKLRGTIWMIVKNTAGAAALLNLQYLTESASTKYQVDYMSILSI